MNHRLFRNGGYIVAVALLVGVYSCSSSKKAQQDTAATTPVATWQAQPVTIDGDDSDWVKPLRYYDNRQLLSYTITNDKENIYIILSTKNSQTQLRMLRGGFTVWLNKAGEKTDNGAAGIAIPGNRSSRGNRQNTENGTGAGDDGGRVAGEREKLSALDNLSYFSLFGFSKDNVVENVDYGKTSHAGVDVKININKLGVLVYEAQIPYAALYGKNGNFAGRDVAVGIFMDDAAQQGNGGRGGRGGGTGFGVGMGMGMGSFGGSGMGMSIGRSFGGGGGRGGSQAAKEDKIWEVVALAKEPK